MIKFTDDGIESTFCDGVVTAMLSQEEQEVPCYSLIIHGSEVLFTLEELKLMTAAIEGNLDIQ